MFNDTPAQINSNEGRMEMFYLMMHLTFYLQLYGIRHIAEDHIISERGNPLLTLHELLLLISSKGSFICAIPQTGKYISQSLLHQLWSTGWKEK